MDRWLHGLSVILADARGVRGRRAGHWADLRHDEQARRERADGCIEGLFVRECYLLAAQVWGDSDRARIVVYCQETRVALCVREPEGPTVAGRRRARQALRGRRGPRKRNSRRATS